MKSAQITVYFGIASMFLAFAGCSKSNRSEPEVTGVGLQPAESLEPLENSTAPVEPRSEVGLPMEEPQVDLQVPLFLKDTQQEFTTQLSRLAPESLETLALYRAAFAKQASTKAESAAVGDYWQGTVPDFRENAARLQKIPLVANSAPVSFVCSNGDLSLIIGPDASVGLERNGSVISTAESKAWSIHKWIDREGRFGRGSDTPLEHMQQTGENELLLWSADAQFRVLLRIDAQERYFKFELVHVSNDPKTGGLTDDWLGHRVEFDLGTYHRFG